MIEELNTATALLDAALDRYISACSAIENYTITREFSDRVIEETGFALSYETKLRKAKAAIGRGRNSSAALVPINALPSEIMANIFSLVRDPERGQLCDPYPFAELKPPKIPKYPDLLLQVCSRWRQVLLSSHSFWSHIDIALCHPEFGPRFLDRAELYVARSGRANLDLCIVDVISSNPKKHYADEGTFNSGVLQLIPLAANRMSSLNIKIGQNLTDIHRTILDVCFAHAVPGALTELALTADSFLSQPTSYFIEPKATSHGNDSILLDIDHQLLEDILAPVTELHLCGPFPYWTSSAYRGLSHLYLMPNEPCSPSMTELQLIGILVASPQLRSLFLGDIRLMELNQGYPPSVVPVPLDYLEDLSLEMEDSHTLGAVLRMVAPGAGSLSVHMRFSVPQLTLPLSVMKAAEDFLSRSVIDELYIEGTLNLLWLAELLTLPRHLRDLVIDDFQYQPDRRMPLPHNNEVATPPRRLDSMHIINSCIDLGELRHIFRRSPPQTLILSHTRIHHNGKIIRHEPQQKVTLASVCPVVEIRNGQVPATDLQPPSEPW